MNNLLNKTCSCRRRAKGSLFLFLLILTLFAGTVPAWAAVRPGDIKNLSARSTAGSVTLKWSKASDADGYYVYEATSSGGGKKIAETAENKTTYTISLLQSGATYRYYVRACAETASSVIKGKKSETVTAVTKGTPLEAPALRLGGLASEKIGLLWNAVPKATSYQVYAKKKGSSYELIGTTKATSFVAKKLTNGRYYTFKVRALSGKGKKAAAGLFSNAVTAKPSIKRIVLASTVRGICYTATIVGNPVCDGKTLYHGTSVIVLSEGTYTSKVQLASASGLSQPVYTVSNGNISQNGLYTNDKHKYSNAVAMAFVNTQGYKSRTPYLIWVNFYTQCMYIFTGYQYHWKILYTWKCSTGKFETKTKVGIGPIWMKQPTADFDAASFAYYASFFGGDAIHSWVYLKGTNDTPWIDGRLGAPASHGCIRIMKENAKWVYDNCPIGTTLVRY